MSPKTPKPAESSAVPDAPADPMDRQSHLRRSIFVTGQLLAGDVWHPCAIMNVSDGGARIRMEAASEIAGRGTLQIPDHAGVLVEIIWQEDDIVGLRFAEDSAVIAAFVAALDLAPPSPLELRRHQRCSVLWPARVYSAGREVSATILNLSASGAKVQLRDQAILTERVTLFCDRFGDLPARLVWRNKDEIGVEFLDPPELISQVLGDTLPRVRQDIAADRDDD